MKIRHLIEELGFSSIAEMAQTLSGFKTVPTLILQIGFAWYVNLSGFTSTWVYDPPNAVFVVVGLIVSDTILGFWLAMKKNGKADLRKLTRVLPITLAHVGIMSVSFHFSKVDPTSFSWMPTAVFAFFGIRHLISVIKNLTQLGLIKGDLLNVINSRITTADEDTTDSTSKISKANSLKSESMVVLLLVASALIGGCASQTRCYKKWPYVQGDTVWLHDTLKVVIPGTNTQANVSSSKLFNMKAGDSLTVTSPDGNTKAVVKRLQPTVNDSVGGYQISSIQKGRVEKKYIRLPCPPQKFLVPAPEVIYKVPAWVWMAFGAIGVAWGYQTFRTIF